MSRAKRIAVVVAAALIAAAFLRREANRGSLDSFDRGFLSWLSGNAPGMFAESAVTFLRLADGDGAEADRIFEAWPPSALDFAVLAENLRKFQPKIVAIEPVLRWDGPDAVAAPSLTEMLGQLDHVILGAALIRDPTAPAITDADSALDRFLTLNPDRIAGDVASLPEFTGIAALPAAELLELPNVMLAFSEIDLGEGPVTFESGVRVPLLARHAGSGRVIPSFALAAALAHDAIPASVLRVDLGESIEFGNGVSIPVDERGFARIPSEAAALPLRAPADILILAGAEFAPPLNPAARAVLESLDQHVVILGLDDSVRQIHHLGETPVSAAELSAVTVATIQSGRHLRSLSANGESIVLAAVLAWCAILGAQRRRSRILGLAALSLILFAAASLIAFQDFLVWWRASPPVGALAAGALAAFFVCPGRKNTGDGTTGTQRT